MKPEALAHLFTVATLIAEMRAHEHEHHDVLAAVERIAPTARGFDWMAPAALAHVREAFRGAAFATTIIGGDGSAEGLIVLPDKTVVVWRDAGRTFHAFDAREAAMKPGPWCELVAKLGRLARPTATTPPPVA